MNNIDFLLNHKNLPPAMLFENDAEYAFVQHLIQTRLCERHTACGQCQACLLLHASSHPDLTVIAPHEAQHAIKVEQVREVFDFTYQTPLLAAEKIIWIQAADSMNIYAANALLKILEEPSLTSHFILSVSNKNLLPKTILSRCWQFQSAQDQASIEFLKYLPYLSAYLKKEIDLLQFLKNFEHVSVEDSLIELQQMTAWLIQKRLDPHDTYSSEDVGFLCAIPISRWWDFWDALLEYRPICRQQVHVQPQVLLSRLLMILNGVGL